MTTATVFSRYTMKEFSRSISHPIVLAEVIVMPLAIYIGVTFSTSFFELPAGKGIEANIHFFTACGIALYGVAATAAQEGSTICIEREHGWLRTLKLTQLSMVNYLFSKCVIGFILSALSLLSVLFVAWLRGAQAPVSYWILMGVSAIVIAAQFGFFGMAVGLLGGPSTVARFLSLAIMLIAFASNLFVPLEGSLYECAKFTPMYGSGMLGRALISHIEGGAQIFGQQLVTWQIVANCAVWTVVAFALAVVGQRRSLGR